MEIILGHLIGDYLLQSTWMASNKKNKGLKGFIACSVHCMLWSFSVYLLAFYSLVGILNLKALIIMVLLFISHFILDRTYIVKWYCNITKIYPNPPVWYIYIVDNTLHISFVYIIMKVLIA